MKFLLSFSTHFFHFYSTWSTLKFYGRNALRKLTHPTLLTAYGPVRRVGGKREQEWEKEVHQTDCRGIGAGQGGVRLALERLANLGLMLVQR